MRKQARIGLVAGGLAALPIAFACTAEAHRVGFGIDFAAPGLRSRAELVEATLLRGGCDGPVVFSTALTRMDQGNAPQSLGEGNYGFAARARDRDCVWFAAGCTEARLPSDASLTVVLSEMRREEREPGCGVPAGPGLDAGDASDFPPGEGDPSDPGAGQGDASEPGAQQELPKCAETPGEVVACFDFDDSLDDASSYGNDAAGAGARFEGGLSARALRVAGTTVNVQDHESLNFTSSFTIELWLRADSLVNVASEPDEVSVLLDKDQQYTVGFDSAGDLWMEVYRGSSDRALTTAEAANIVPGEWTYVAFVYDGSRTRLYQDGRALEQEQVDVTLSGGNGRPLHIGSGSPASTHPFDGLLDAVKVWDVARSEREICGTAFRTYTGNRCR